MALRFFDVHCVVSKSDFKTSLTQTGSAPLATLSPKGEGLFTLLPPGEGQGMREGKVS